MYEPPAEPAPQPATTGRGTVYLVLAFVASTLLGLLRGKLTAVLIGPAGVSLYAQAANLLQLGGALGSLGLGLCIVREVAMASGAGDHARMRVVVRTAVILQAIAVSLLLVGGLAWSAPLARWVFQRDWRSIGVLTLCTVPFVVGTTVVGAVLQGRGALRLYGRALVFGALTNTILVPVGARLGGTEGAILGSLLAGVFTLALYLIVVRDMPRAGGLGTPSRPVLGRNLIWLLVSFGSASLVHGAFEMGAQLVLRRSLIAILGESQTGVFQASLTVSAQTGALFTLLIGATLFPTLSRCRSVQEICDEVEQSLRLTLSLLMPILLGTILARDLIAPVLFSPAFSAVSPIIPIQALGDFFRIATWPLSYVMLARGRVKTHLAVAVVLNVLLAWAPAFGASRFGVAGAAWGYASAVLLVFAGVFLLQGFIAGLRLRASLVGRFVTDLLLLVLAASPALLGWPRGVGFAAALLWALLVLARPTDRRAISLMLKSVKTHRLWLAPSR